MEVTLGGNRVGSGQKMKSHLHNYNRSTHNLSEKFASSAASGVLYPCMCKLAMRGDTFDININADARTIPTKGPLFGSYKLQIDVYQCPVRLYQGLLHNNPQAIGLNMSQIKFPIIKVKSEHKANSYGDEGEFSKSCLLKYLGMSGLGSPKVNAAKGYLGRDINALPLLSYYDIYKTYYANKQEEQGFIISGTEGNETLQCVLLWGTSIDKIHLQPEQGNARRLWSDDKCTFAFVINDKLTIDEIKNIQQINFSNMNSSTVDLTIQDLINNFGFTLNRAYGDVYELVGDTAKVADIFEDAEISTDGQITYITTIDADTTTKYVYEKLELKKFALSNIDEMRYKLLSAHTLGVPFAIGLESDVDSYDSYYGEQEGELGDSLPYSANFLVTEKDNVNGEHLTYNKKFPMNGLALKTYQNDIYNNWLNTEWIEGENGINEMTKVTVDNEGTFSMDSLNFAQKLYNMLNRIAVAGNTYEDWQDVVYEEVQRRQIESPMYCGGFSQEVMFDEIVQSAPANINGETSELGTLGGRGKLVQGTQKGGNIHIKCDEACFIIAIVSLTPRIFYTQGNEFYLTDIFSMDDLHKPAMDGIGFQDLVGERLAWFNSVISNEGNKNFEVYHRSRIGKLPAWIEYMTSVDKAYGDFAENYGKGYMILNRNYETEESNGKLTSTIKDATTYIDPSKYNYAFAYTELEAQNFWIEIAFDIKARRLMSARLIPNV